MKTIREHLEWKIEMREYDLEAAQEDLAKAEQELAEYLDDGTKPPGIESLGLREEEGDRDD